MNIVKILFNLMFCLVLVALACSPHADHKDLKQLRQTIDEFYAAIDSGDTAKRLSLFAADALILPDHGELIKFDDNVKEAWVAADAEWIFRLKDVQHVEIAVSGDLAYSVNTYAYTFHPINGQPEWHKTKNVHIWKKQNDGAWKLHVDIWNSSAPNR